MKKNRIQTRIKMYEKKQAYKCMKNTRIQMYEKTRIQTRIQMYEKNSYTNV